MRTVVEARGLRKRFGSFWALDGLDLEVREGEVHGFLGPNGSGKSTTIRALLGQLRLDGGSARIFGLDCWDDAMAVHRRLAYVPGEVRLWPSLTGGECIDTLLRFQGTHDRARRDELVRRFDLDPTKRARTYSKGNRQKVALIAALAAHADLLLLDEPTSGLDPLMESTSQRTVRELTAEGCTVLLSSHQLAEVEALCDRVSIIRAGRTIDTGSLDDLRTQAQNTVRVTTAAPPPALDGMTVLDAQPVPDGGVRTSARVGAAALPGVVRALLDAGGTGLVVEPPSLDELFMQHYREP
ncbi:MAG: ABC transporter ATP-binding protein [Thermoleophilia bacterium]